jgi:hypothetical protein
VVQAHVVQLARTVGGKVWVLGVHRRGTDFQGTMQTPGISDLVLFIPEGGRWHLVFFECKAAGGRLSREQVEFRDLVLAVAANASVVHHLVGGLDPFIAWLVTRGLVKAENVAHYRRPQVAL